MCTTGRRPSAHKLGQELGRLGPDVAPQQQRRPTKQTREQRLKTLALERTRRRAKGFAAPAAGAPRRPFECTFREPSPGEPGFDAAGAQRSKLRVSAHGRRLDGRPL